MELAKKSLSVFFAFVLAFSLCVLVPPQQQALAAPGDVGTIEYYKARWAEAAAKVHWTDTSGMAGVSKWTGNAAGTVPAQGAGTNDNPYLVTTADEFRYCVATGGGKAFKLMTDIDLGGATNAAGAETGPVWVGPTITQNVVMDGNGHTVYNLYQYFTGNAAGENCWGLLGAVNQGYNGFVLKNLNMQSVKLTCVGTVGQNVNMASLIGRFNGGTVDGCVVRDAAVDNGSPCNHDGGNGTGGLFAPDNDGGSSVTTIRNTKAINVNVYGRGCVSGFIEGPWSGASSLTIENCSAVDGTVISTGGHSGGFTSCVQTGTATYRNCYINDDVYGNTETGVFVGVTHGGHHKFDNCYAAGKIEGTNSIGGFYGNPSGPNSETFTNCFSTSMVGMSNAGLNMGGFAGVSGSTSTFKNCYAAGEVGTLWSDKDGTPLNADGTRLEHQNVAGFVGNRGGGSFTNCYYDKQTTAMCDLGVGSGVTALLTKSVTKTDDQGKQTKTQGLIGLAAINDDPANPAWSFSEGGYPELRVFSDPSYVDPGAAEGCKNTADLQARAYSQASVSTVQLFAEGDKADEYDTVRSIRYVFPLTNNANSGKSDFDIAWKVYEGEDPEHPLYPNKSRLVQGNPPIITLADVGTKDNVSALAPGIGWLQVNAAQTEDGNTSTGMRRLRLVPTTSIAWRSPTTPWWASTTWSICLPATTSTRAPTAPPAPWTRARTCTSSTTTAMA